MASLGNFRGKGRLLALTAGGAGLCLVLFGLSPWFALSAVLAAAIGATLMAYDVVMATLLQLLTSDAMRGRVMGLYAFTFGFTPLGGFLAGIVASAVGAPFAVGMGGAIILAYVTGVVRRLSRVREAAP